MFRTELVYLKRKKNRNDLRRCCFFGDRSNQTPCLRITVQAKPDSRRRKSANLRLVGTRFAPCYENSCATRVRLSSRVYRYTWIHIPAGQWVRGAYRVGVGRVQVRL